MRFLLLFLVACGGKLSDDDASFEDGGMDAPFRDAIARREASVVYDATEEKPPPGPCTIGPNLGLPLAQCSAAVNIWFASPYVPPTDITVTRIEAYMRQGDVALLESANGAPGTPLFMGSVGTSPMPAWIGANVSPPVMLKGGTLYYLGFQGDCSFTVGGGEPVEYIADTINGSWMVSGTDNWTARLIGTCN